MFKRHYNNHHHHYNHGLLNLNFPQTNKVRKSDHVTIVSLGSFNILKAVIEPMS